jgi:hypothetical protein
MMGKRGRSVLPPWLWLWLLFSLFLTFSNGFVQHPLLDLFAGSATNQAAMMRLTHLPWLYRIFDLVDLWTPLLFVLGVLTVLTPRKRATDLEKRWGLQEDLTPVPNDLVAFIHHLAPELQIKVNPRRSDLNACSIYPSGYRKATIAIFVPMIVLWDKKDKRSAAEAILLHEIAHYQNGDALVVGEGSFLAIALNRWLLIFLLFGLTPSIILWIEQAINFVQTSSRLGIPPQAQFMPEVIGTLTISVPFLLLGFVVEVLQTISLILLPIVAMWCIELNADQTVLRGMRPTEDLIRALSSFQSPNNWWEWLIAQTAHPPRTIRRWMAHNMTEQGSVLLLLMSFPLAAFSLLLGVVPTFIGQYLNEVVSPQGTNLVRLLAVDIGSTLATIAPLWGSMAVILLVWPLVGAFWEQIFARSVEGVGVAAQATTWTKHRVYYFCACLTALFAFWSYIIYMLTK